jgi:hypothetical protein
MRNAKSDTMASQPNRFHAFPSSDLPDILLSDRYPNKNPLPGAQFSFVPFLVELINASLHRTKNQTQVEQDTPGNQESDKKIASPVIRDMSWSRSVKTHAATISGVEIREVHKQTQKKK